MVSQNELIERFSFHNPWWREKRVSPDLRLSFERPILLDLLSHLKLNRILVIKGPRRTGKTTLIYQIIDHLLEEGVSPKDVLYLSFDDINLRLPLEETFSAFEIYRGRPLSEGEAFIFLDEIQFLSNWELTVKLYFDRKYPIKFIASGSSATLLTQDLESLAGRTIEEVIYPFSFAEMALYSLKDKQFVTLFSQLKASFDPFSEPTVLLAPYKKELEIIFQSYLKHGGFPHLLEEPKELYPRLLSEDVIQKVIYRDLTELYQIRQPSSLERLFSYLGKTTAGIVNLTTLSQNLDLSRPAVENYISFLEKAFLYFRLSKYSHSAKETARSNPKGHVIDPGIASLFLAPDNQALESMVAAKLYQVYGRNLYFWRNRGEVDLVLKQGWNKKLVPIEIKNTSQIEVDSLLEFVKKFKTKQGLYLYRGPYKRKAVTGFKIICYPIWQFLLLV